MRIVFRFIVACALFLGEPTVWAQTQQSAPESDSGGANNITDTDVNNNADQLPNSLNEGGGDTPLVLDWNKDGVIEVLSQTTQDKVFFDITASGKAKATDWIQSGEVFLALDLNQNGVIDSGAELFGNATIIERTGTRAIHGFQALAQYDQNKDGIIDHRDPVFERLLVWNDRNLNGISEPDELIRLHKTNIAYLRLDYRDISFAEGHLPNSNSAIRQLSSYGVHGDDREFKLADVYFNVMVEIATVEETKASEAN